MSALSGRGEGGIGGDARGAVEAPLGRGRYWGGIVLGVVVARIIAWLLLGAEARAGEATIVDEAGLELRVEWAGPAPTFFGFTPVWVRARNDRDEAVAWNLEAQIGGAYTSRIGLNVTGARIEVPPHAAREQVWLVPVAASGFTRSFAAMALQIHATGPGTMPLPAYVMAENVNSAMEPLLVSPRLEQALRARMASTLKGDPSIAVYAPGALPGDWRAWSSFAHVWITHEEWRVLDAERRGALRDWVAWGGRLAVFFVPPEVAGEEVVALGRIAWRQGSPEEISEADYGRLLDVPAGTALPQSDEVVDPWERERWQRGGTAEIWVALVLFLTALVIGPLNFFVFAGAGRRHRIFVTTPVIAGAAALLLGAIIVLADGFGGEGRRRTLIVLVPERARALVHQEQVSRTGLLLGRGFPLADDAVCALAPSDERRAPNLELERGVGRATGDWFRNRAVQTHVLRRVTPSRARIEQVDTGASGEPVVVSSVAAPLTDFIYRDAKGQRWQAAALAPGERVTLRAVDGPNHGPWRDVEDRPYTWNRLTTELHERSGWWAARAAAVPELAPIATLDSIAWADDQVIVTGPLQREGGEGAAERAAPVGPEGRR